MNEPADELKIFHRTSEVFTRCIGFFQTCVDCYRLLLKNGIQDKQDPKIYAFILKLFEKLRFVQCHANLEADKLYYMLVKRQPASKVDIN